MSYSETPSPSAGAGIAFGSRVEIMPGAPLPDLNSAGGNAYAARLKGDAASELVAILCNANTVPRIDAVNSMRSVDNPSVLKLIDSGVIHWPKDDVRYYGFAFQKPTAPRMATSLDQTFPTMTEDNANQYFVYPMINALVELERTGLVHNAIRTTNIFWRAGGTTAPQLGECMSAPAGYGQPVVFETIERAMCAPQGRGIGTHSDDCYALGVTIALMVLGSNPFQGMNDASIVQTKIERGTFNAVIGNRRASPSHVELFRGLLSDDARQRWSVSDLEQWTHGRRLTPKNSDAGRRAGRQIEFNGKSYWQVRPLAAALAGNVSAGVQFIENGTLDKWLRRAMGDEERANDIEEVRTVLKENSKLTHFDDQLIARTCIALDPQGPIRYRGLSIMPAGVADMLIEGVITGQNVQAVSEIISSQLVTFWVEMQKDAKTDAVPLAQQFERIRGTLEKSSLGYGVERAVYELNQGLPCLSPMLRSQYVTTAKALLPALERLAIAGGRPIEPMDRHIAAFIAVRDRRGDMLFQMIAHTDPARRGAGLLSLYSEIQSRHGPDTLQGLAQWLLPLLEPILQRYLSKALREKLQGQLRDTASRGDLAALARLVDDPNRIEFDRQQFRAARMLYLNTMKEIAHLEHKLANRETVMRSTGKPMAATISVYLAIVFVMVAIMRAIWQYLMS